MSKLFADRLQILETKINDIHSTENINERLNTLEKKINELDAKITQIINEITPIITSHANALNALLGHNTK